MRLQSPPGVPRFVMAYLLLPVRARPVGRPHDVVHELPRDRDGGDASHALHDALHPWRDAFPVFPHHRVTPDSPLCAASICACHVRCACAPRQQPNAMPARARSCRMPSSAAGSGCCGTGRRDAGTPPAASGCVSCRAWGISSGGARAASRRNPEEAGNTGCCRGAAMARLGKPLAARPGCRGVTKKSQGFFRTYGAAHRCADATPLASPHQTPASPQRRRLTSSTHSPMTKESPEELCAALGKVPRRHGRSALIKGCAGYSGAADIEGYNHP